MEFRLGKYIKVYCNDTKLIEFEQDIHDGRNAAAWGTSWSKLKEERR